MAESPAHIAARPWRPLLFILLCGTAIRCIGITQPFIDTWSWRQGDVAMIAHHFAQNGFHLFYPEINWGGPPHGDVRGYVGTEWPIMPWLAAVIYQLTGEHEWVGRGLSVLAWACSLPAFFLYVRRLVNDRTALFACAIYALMPLSIYTARSFMPDMPSLAAALWALALFDYWLDRRGSVGLIAGTIAAIALAILIKPPSIMIGFPMLVRGLQKRGPRILADGRLWLIAIVPMIPAYDWFTQAAWLGHAYFPHHFFGAEGLKIESVAFYLGRLADMALNGMTPVGTAAAVVAMIIAWRDRRLWPVYAWLAGWAMFFVIAGHGNRHQWYQLPLVPVLAIFAAVLVVWLYVRIAASQKILAAIAVFSVMAGIAATALFGLTAYAADSGLPAMNAGLAVKRLTPADAVILVANEGDPVVFYYADRYGWHFHHDDSKSGLYQDQPAKGHEADFAADIVEGCAAGARFFVLSSQDFWWLDPKSPYTAFAGELGKWPIIDQTADYRIYDLRGPAAKQR